MCIRDSVNVQKGYEGQNGSVIHYRGLVQGPNNSYVDVIHSETASGTSKVSFGDDHSKIPVSGIFKEARGEKTLKSEGIPIFVIADKGIEGDQLRLEMQPFGVVAKDNEAYKWIYSLGYNDEEQGSQRTWAVSYTHLLYLPNLFSPRKNDLLKSGFVLFR